MKKLLMLVFAFFMVLTLVGCTKPEEKPEEKPEDEAEYKLGMGVVVSETIANATSDSAGNAQVDATVATVVTDKDGKIVLCRIDVAQNKTAVASDGTITLPTDWRTKMEKGPDYGMGGKPYSPDNNGDGVVEEWDFQAKVFENYVVGKTGTEVAALETQEVGGHLISKDEALLDAKCTIQITDFQEAVAKACNDAQGMTFKTAKEFTLGVAAASFDDSSKSATATEDGAITMYTDFAATVICEGKILAALNDAIQPKFTVSATGELTYSFVNTKRELKEEYGMGGKPYSPDNDGDGRVLEWYVQSEAFSKHVVGMSGEEVLAMTTKEANDHQISTDEKLLAAGCTIQITAIKAVVAEAASYAR